MWQQKASICCRWSEGGPTDLMSIIQDVAYLDPLMTRKSVQGRPPLGQHHFQLSRTEPGLRNVVSPRYK
jgi:hypothetical protein